MVASRLCIAGESDEVKMSTGFLKTWRMRVAGAALVGFSAAAAASAATFGFTGSLGVDNDVQVFNFTVANDGTAVQIRNWGYGGGSFAADSINGGAGGTVSIGSANFDGRLTLFNGAGVKINTNENTGFLFQQINPLQVVYKDGDTEKTAFAFYDPELRLTLNAGAYTLILSQYENKALGGVADGFTYDGNPTYTTSEALFNNQCAAGYFCDQIAYDTGIGYNRAGLWATEIKGAQTASAVSAVPVPAALPLLAVAIGALGFLRTRKRA
jgi:hypothetical protein